jgi:hypothetical protein
VKDVKVFMSHASDAEEEYKIIKDIISEENDNHFVGIGYRFDPFCWRDIPPGLGHPQVDKIDPFILDPDCRLIILILKNRLGTIHEDGKTGIEHEYELAKKSGKEIMIFHCDFLIRSSEIEPEQLKFVNEFILRVKSEGLIEDRIFSNEYLKNIFRSKFSLWAKKFIDGERDYSKEFEKYSRGF